MIRTMNDGLSSKPISQNRILSFFRSLLRTVQVKKIRTCTGGSLLTLTSYVRGYRAYGTSSRLSTNIWCAGSAASPRLHPRPGRHVVVVRHPTPFLFSRSSSPIKMGGRRKRRGKEREEKKRRESLRMIHSACLHPLGGGEVQTMRVHVTSR